MTVIEQISPRLIIPMHFGFFGAPDAFFELAKEKYTIRSEKGSTMTVSRKTLPKNTEIEAALMSWQRLFGGTTHASSLQEQRRVALDAMKVLAQFEPRLVGPVLAGSATEFADIQLHVFSDSAEVVCMHLMDRRYDYEVFERKMRMAPERQVTVPSIRFEMGEETIEAFVFPKDGIRQAPISPVDGRPMRRAGTVEVENLAAT